MGFPNDADLVFDVRFLPNPYYVEALRSHTGQEAEVQAYVRQGGTADRFLSMLYGMLDFLIPNYVQEGKNQLVIAIGCTGGRAPLRYRGQCAVSAFKRSGGIRTED